MNTENIQEVEEVKDENEEGWEEVKTEIDLTEVAKEAQAFIDENLNRKDIPVMFLNSYDIFAKYPNFINKLREFFKEVTLQEDIPDDMLHQLLFASPRTLYDLLDYNKIYINVGGKGQSWGYAMVDTENIEYTTPNKGESYASRPAAEYHAIMEAINILNKQN